jgi:hypothetical protein
MLKVKKKCNRSLNHKNKQRILLYMLRKPEEHLSNQIAAESLNNHRKSEGDNIFDLLKLPRFIGLLRRNKNRSALA